MKIIGYSFAGLMLLILIIPGAVTFLFGADNYGAFSVPITQLPNNTYDDEPFYYSQDNYNEETEPVYATNPDVGVILRDGEGEEVSFEDYIMGVVAAEMPASFHAEALKAQAVAARTYALRRTNGYKAMTKSDIEAISQAYLSIGELKARWGEGFNENYAKIRSAVSATAGEILVYDDEPIEAVFHAQSAGKTQNAENVWSKEYPYLKGVLSNETQNADEKRFSYAELKNRLEQHIGGIQLTGGSFLEDFDILKADEAGYILEARVGGVIVTGADIRTALGLKSAAFNVLEEGGEIVFSTRGYGHGVGMSQGGANLMAQDGALYHDILLHYYQGAAIRKTNTQ